MLEYLPQKVKTFLNDNYINIEQEDFEGDGDPYISVPYLRVELDENTTYKYLLRRGLICDISELDNFLENSYTPDNFNGLYDYLGVDAFKQSITNFDDVYKEIILQAKQFGYDE